MRNWYEARNFCNNKSASMMSPNGTNDQTISTLIKTRNNQMCKEIWVAYHKEDWVNVKSKSNCRSRHYEYKIFCYYDCTDIYHDSRKPIMVSMIYGYVQVMGILIILGPKEWNIPCFREDI